MRPSWFRFYCGFEKRACLDVQRSVGELDKLIFSHVWLKCPHCRRLQLSHMMSAGPHLVCIIPVQGKLLAKGTMFW